MLAQSSSTKERGPACVDSFRVARWDVLERSSQKQPDDCHRL